MSLRGTLVTLNVSGERFETYRETLQCYPGTLLAELGKQSPHYCPKTDEYYFDRNRIYFEAILFFYQSAANHSKERKGILKRPPGSSIEYFEKECQYFKLPNHEIRNMMLREGKIPELSSADVKPKRKKKRDLKKRIWNILDEPETSNFASIFALFSLTAICVAILSSCVLTVHSVTNKHVWSDIEKGLNFWFVLEFLLRFLTCPSKWYFVKNLMNWIDAVSIFPSFVMFFISNESSLLNVLRTTRLLRIVRVLHVSKQSKRLRAMLLLIWGNLADITTFLVVFLMLVILGASIGYFAEGGCTHGFESVPSAMWWAAASVTTVGYGDITPHTPLGQVMALFFIVLGIVTISLPILSINAKIGDTYEANFGVKAET